MARRPLQVLVIPYRQRCGHWEFAVFRRADEPAWQFPSGGAEDDETPEQAARREAWEEAAIPANLDLRRLDSQAAIPREAFPGTDHWPTTLRFVPEHAFAVDVGDLELRHSHEHLELRWLASAEALSLLTWESNRSALNELQTQLERARFLSPEVPST